MVIFWLNVWILKSWLLKYHENRYTNRVAAAVDVQLQRIEHESCRNVRPTYFWFSCVILWSKVTAKQGLDDQLTAHTRTHLLVFCFCLSPLCPPPSPVYRRVRSFTSPCFWCAGRAGRAGEEGARPHRQPGQEQPEQRGCGRTERRIGGRRAQKRRVTYQKKPLFSDRLGWCEGDTTTPVFKASIYPANLHFVFFFFFLLFFYFILFYDLSFASAASIYFGAVHSVHGQILLRCSGGAAHLYIYNADTAGVRKVFPARPAAWSSLSHFTGLATALLPYMVFRRLQCPSSLWTSS